MDRAAAKFTISALMGEFRARIDGAAGIARAAEACIEAGNPDDKGVEIALDLEQPLFEATRLLDGQA